MHVLSQLAVYTRPDKILSHCEKQILSHICEMVMIMLFRICFLDFWSLKRLPFLIKWINLPRGCKEREKPCYMNNCHHLSYLSHWSVCWAAVWALQWPGPECIKFPNYKICSIASNLFLEVHYFCISQDWDFIVQGALCSP